MNDKALVDAAVAKAWGSSTGRRVIEEFNRLGTTRIRVLSDQELAAEGLQGANGAFSSRTGDLVLSRSLLEEGARDPRRLGAVATLVHELGHAVDAATGVEQQFVSAAGGGTPIDKAAINFAMEARGEYLEGTVVRELDGTIATGRRVRDISVAEIFDKDVDPSLVAAAGGSFEQVWQKLQADRFRNPDGLTGVPMLVARNSIL